MHEDLVRRLRVFADDGYLLHTSTGEALREAADAIEALSKIALDEHNRAAVAVWERRWIPVTERLPELNAPCLVYNKAQPMMVGWRIDDKRFRIPGSFLPDHPTHWMPLPQPPKEEGER